MGRKSIEIAIVAANRDQGKVFVITEMPCAQAEEWAIRAIAVVAQTGFELPDGAGDAGYIMMAAVGFQSFLKGDWKLVKPLLDEMKGCIQFKAPVAVRPLIEEDIEEISTWAKLRDEVFSLHAGFSMAAALSTLAAAPRSEELPSRDIPTSLEILEP